MAMAFRYSCSHREREAEVRSIYETVQNVKILQFEPRRELRVPCVPCSRRMTHEECLSSLAHVGDQLPDLFLDFFWLLVLMEDQQGISLIRG